MRVENKMKADNNETKKIVSLEALRGLAFLAVFLSHTGLFNNYFTCLGAWGVSIFLMLSGFVLIYSYYNKNRIKKVSIISNFKFCINKISYLYVLHIICTVAMAVFLFVGNNKEPFSTSVLKITLNAFLLQEYFPINGRSINTVSWYLCVTVLGYFIFPYILRVMEKNYSTKKARISIIIFIATEFFIGFIGSEMPALQSYDDMFWENDLCFWLVYYFPLSRVVDILIGFNLGYLYLMKSREKNTEIVKEHKIFNLKIIFNHKTTAVEIFAFIFSLIGCLSFWIMAPKLQIGDMPSVSVPARWWTYSLIFIPSTVFLIYSFSLSDGLFTKILTNRLTLFLAKISSSAFLIHYVVFRYLSIIYYRFPGYSGTDFFSRYGCWINLSLGFAITVFLSMMWEKIKKLFLSMKKKL